ncbi:MAG TPA: cupin domain-containing protein [Polyangiaceae bacterium]|nr:cupin domain-containing protein [Polyangiaceae bacterium]
MSLAEWQNSVLNKQAWARPGVARDVLESCGWDSLGRLLRARPSPDVLVVAAGKLTQDPAPRSLVELNRLMRRGIGLCLRRCERHDAALGDFTSSFAGSLGRRAHLQVFATPGGTHGFGWHYDAEDVFIVQTAGVKDYYFRENTVDRRVPDGTNPDFSRFLVEKSPLQTARLIAGDCLYIPARWWHMAKCVEDALSMSLGIWEPLANASGLRPSGARP